MVATFFEPEEMKGHAEQAGFEVEKLEERPPYDFEYQSRRVYLLAHRT